jgi:hypothetical protein
MDAKEVLDKFRKPLLEAAKFRVFTPKGKRVTLKRAIPAGSTVKFTTEDGKTAMEVEVA